MFTTIFISSAVLTFTILVVVNMTLPSLYLDHRETNVKKMVNTLVNNINNKTVSEIEDKLETMTRNNIMYVKLSDNNNKTVYERNKFLIDMNRHKDINLKQEKINLDYKLKIKNSALPFSLHITSIFYPVKDTAEAITSMMPFIFVIVLFLSLLGSYVYSELITRPLLNIINKEQLEMAKKKEFIGAISHELKTPITIISGQLEGMIHNIGKYKDRDAYLKKCYETTQDLRFLVAKMIDISKKDLFEINVEKRRVNLNIIISETIERQKFLFEQKNIRLLLNLQDNTNIYANSEDMNTVFNNLINNAVKYSPEGGQISITTTPIKKNFSVPYVRVTIENSGVVLTKEQLSKIFDPLYRVETSRNKNTGGSGLGLYFVSQILKNHNFYYKMFSRENSTVFVVEFDSFNI